MDDEISTNVYGVSLHILWDNKKNVSGVRYSQHCLQTWECSGIWCHVGCEIVARQHSICVWTL